MKRSFGKVFAVFEILLSMVVANLLLVIGSFLSVFLLFPVLLVSTLYYLRRMYRYREYTGIIYNYTNFIRGNVLKTIKLLYPLALFIVLLLFSLFYYNRIILDLFHPYFILAITLVQAFMLYQALGVMLVASILYIRNEKASVGTLLNKAFIIFNAHPFRGLLSMASLAMGGVFVVMVFPIAYLILLPLILFMFYVVYSDVVEQERFM
ncbi:MAG: hypothetical protein ACOCU0_03750 [Bacillota bacterium]